MAVPTVMLVVLGVGAGYLIYRRQIRPRMVRNGVVPEHFKIHRVVWAVLTAYLIVLVGAGAATWALTGSVWAGLGLMLALAVLLQMIGGAEAARRSWRGSRSEKPEPPAL